MNAGLATSRPDANTPMVGTRSSISTRTAAASPARCGSGTVSIRSPFWMRASVLRGAVAGCGALMWR